MKKTVGMICLILLLLGSNSTQVSAETETIRLNVSASEYFKGRNFTVYVSLENAVDISGLQLKLEYDSTLFEITDGYTNTPGLSYNLTTPGEVIITLLSSTFMINGTRSLIELSISSKVDEPIGQTRSLFTLSESFNHEFIQGNTEEMLTTLSPSYTFGLNHRRALGDINNDHLISMMDVVMMQMHLAEALTLTGNDLEALNLSGNNDLTLTDIINVQKYITGLQSSFSPD